MIIFRRDPQIGSSTHLTFTLQRNVRSQRCVFCGIKSTGTSKKRKMIRESYAGETLVYIGNLVFFSFRSDLE